MKSITLCSDDFGENDAISLGILELVKKTRLQAVTVFSEAPDRKSTRLNSSH